MRRLLAISLLALAAAGCGGGGGEDRLSREDFTRQANETCREFASKIKAVVEPESLDGIEAFTDQAADIARDGRADLAELEPPEELEEDYDRLLETLDVAITDIERLGQAAADGDEGAVQQIAEEGDAKDADSDRIARKLGLDGCAED